MKIFTSIIRFMFLPLVVGCIFFTLFSACNADRPDLPKEYNILRFKVDGQQVVNPTECGEWLNGCDPVVLDHGVLQKTTEFHGGGKGHGLYIYIYRKFELEKSIVLDSIDRIEYKTLGDTNFDDFTEILDYNFIFLERDLEEGWLEGEFDFTVSNDEGDTVKITDGYFKLTIDVY
jgi:hypothetical protein